MATGAVKSDFQDCPGLAQGCSTLWMVRGGGLQSMGGAERGKGGEGARCCMDCRVPFSAKAAGTTSLRRAVMLGYGGCTRLNIPSTQSKSSCKDVLQLLNAHILEGPCNLSQSKHTTSTHLHPPTRSFKCSGHAGGGALAAGSGQQAVLRPGNWSHRAGVWL